MDDEVLFTFAVPLFVMLPRKTKPAKKVILNFNQYHNWSTFQRNEIKAVFTKQLERLLPDERLRHDLGRRAYEQMKDLWNPEVAAQRVIRLYESLEAGSDTPFEDGPCSRAEITRNNWFCDKDYE